MRMFTCVGTQGRKVRFLSVDTSGFLPSHQGTRCTSFSSFSILSSAQNAAKQNIHYKAGLYYPSKLQSLGASVGPCKNAGVHE